MQEQDDVLDDRIHYVLATGKKTKGFNDAIIRQRVEITSPAVALDKLRRAITVKCLDRIGRRWDTMVQQLLLFKKRFGHLRVPQDAKKPWRELVRWVWLTRQSKRLGTLSAERVAELEAIGFDWRVEGQTLKDATGLLTERQFVKKSGFTSISDYRRRGLIKPVGFGVVRGGGGGSGGARPYYHPRQIEELRRKLGVTLTSTKGLVSENTVRKKSRFTGIADYRKLGLIKPAGRAIGASGLSTYYHPRQIQELRRKLGITLANTKGLLSELAFRKKSGFRNISSYRKRGLIKPVGFGVVRGGSSGSVGARPYYHPKQIKELRRKLGITLTSTKGLLNEYAFAKESGFTKIAEYRKRGLIKPVGWAIAGPRLSAHYHPHQIKKLRGKLGITLTSTKGLLNERAFREKPGFSAIAKYREHGLIKPVGWAVGASGLATFYHPRQIKELRDKLGVTLTNTKGLLSEDAFARESGFSQIAKYRKRRLIKPVGWAVGASGLSTFYHPRQIKELRRKLGITLTSTKGLLNERAFGKEVGFTQIASSRKRGLIKPVGWAMTSGSRISAHYHPRQIKELRRKLGITLTSTKGLLTGFAFAKESGFTAITKYRKRGLIKPVGWAISNAGLSPFYHPRQIKELKVKLKVLKQRARPAN